MMVMEVDCSMIVWVWYLIIVLDVEMWASTHLSTIFSSTGIILGLCTYIIKKNTGSWVTLGRSNLSFHIDGVRMIDMID